MFERFRKEASKQQEREVARYNSLEAEYKIACGAKPHAIKKALQDERHQLVANLENAQKLVREIWESEAIFKLKLLEQKDEPRERAYAIIAAEKKQELVKILNFKPHEGFKLDEQIKNQIDNQIKILDDYLEQYNKFSKIDEKLKNLQKLESDKQAASTERDRYFPEEKLPQKSKDALKLIKKIDLRPWEKFEARLNKLRSSPQQSDEFKFILMNAEYTYNAALKGVLSRMIDNCFDRTCTPDRLVNKVWIEKFKIQASTTLKEVNEQLDKAEKLPKAKPPQTEVKGNTLSVLKTLNPDEASLRLAKLAQQRPGTSLADVPPAPLPREVVTASTRVALTAVSEGPKNDSRPPQIRVNG